MFYSVAVNHYLEGGKKSCNQICERHDADCIDTNHGFTDDSTLAIFRDKGVNCTTGLPTDTYSHPDDPKYIKSCFGFTKKCIGWKNIPKKINCGSAPAYPNIERLCPCVTREY